MERRGEFGRAAESGACLDQSSGARKATGKGQRHIQKSGSLEFLALGRGKSYVSVL